MKTTIEYLQALEEELKYLPQKQVRDVIKVYQEKINNALDYGEPIEKVLKSLPSPEEVAKGIYDSKKVNYLDKKKREFRRKEVINGLTSLILAGIVVIVFIGILGYLGIMNLGMLGIISKFNAQDKIIMSIFVISYFLAMLLIMIYLLDIGILITNFLLTKFLILFGNLKIDYDKFQNFSISGFLEKLTKKRYFLGKVLLGVAIVMFVFGATSVVGKGYLSRSFTNSPSTKNEEIYEFSSSIQEIVLDNYKAQIIIQTGEKFKVIKNSEFDHHFQVEEVGTTATITFDHHQNYDFLGLLSEPVIHITIEIPEEEMKDINITLTDGVIGVSKVNIDNLTFNVVNGSVALKDVNIKNFKYETKTAELNSNSCIYETANINVEQGLFATSSDIFGDAKITNGSGNIAVKDNEFGILKIKNTSGNMVIQNTNMAGFDYEAVSTILSMSQIKADYFNMTCKNSSKITLLEMESELFTFDLNTGYVNMTKVTGDINVVNSRSNISISELVGDFTGKIENSKLSIYNSIFDNLQVELVNCNLDLDDLKLKEVSIKATNTQSIIIDLYARNINFDLSQGALQYHNNKDEVIELITIKAIGGQYNIDESVKYGEIKVIE